MKSNFLSGIPIDRFPHRLLVPGSADRGKKNIFYLSSQQEMTRYSITNFFFLT